MKKFPTICTGIFQLEIINAIGSYKLLNGPQESTIFNRYITTKLNYID